MDRYNFIFMTIDFGSTDNIWPRNLTLNSFSQEKGSNNKSIVEMIDTDSRRVDFTKIPGEMK